MTSVLSRNAAFTAHTRPATGDIKSSFIGNDHLGWLLCDGRPLSTATYNLLFQVLGYQFGGSGNSFNLPDARARVVGNIGTITDSCGTYTFPPGDYTNGEVKHKLTIAEMPAHNHDDNTPASNPPAEGNTSTETTGITTQSHTHTSNATGPTPAGGGTGNGYGLIYQNGDNTMNGAVNSGNEPNLYGSSIALIIDPTTVGINDPGHKHQIASNGGDECHNNMQPTLFYGNTFVYCGIPTATNWTTAWNFPAPQVNPPFI